MPYTECGADLIQIGPRQNEAVARRITEELVRRGGQPIMMSDGLSFAFPSSSRRDEVLNHLRNTFGWASVLAID